MAETWTALRLSPSNERLPPLYIKHSFTKNSYSLQLTDLTYLWIETLDRRQIVRRALDEDTSIDPSEGADQMQMLLQKLQDTLRSEGSHRINLLQGTRKGELKLTTITNLPKPLKPLQWDFILTQAQQTEVTKTLVLPLIRDQAGCQEAIESLISHLKEKDHVISKLLNALETSGTDLSNVFPGAAAGKVNRKTAGVEHVAKAVKGIAPFDENEWRSVNGGSATAHFASGDITADSDALTAASAGESRGTWWGTLKTELVNESGPGPVAAQPLPSIEKPVQQPAMSPGSITGDDDDFQVRISQTNHSLAS